MTAVVAALELYLDVVAERRIRNLWTALEEVGVQTLRDLTHGKHRPHLSLTGAPQLDGPAVAEALAGLPAAPPLELKLDFIGQFLGRVLWLGPVPTAALLAHHAAVHERLTQAGVATDPYYHPGNWVPHCTLSMRVPRPKMADAIRLCLDVIPITATVRAAAVADHAKGQWLGLM